MPIQATFQRSFQVSGQSFATARQVSADVAPPFSVVVPPAKSGALTTRTNNTTGELTMAGGHGITTGQRLDLYWVGGSRRGVTVGTVATNAVPISGGLGDNLPDDETAITAMVPTEQAFAVPAGTLVAVAFSAPQGGTAVFADGSNAEVYASVRTPTSPSDVVVVADGTDPFDGTAVAKVFLSHGLTTPQTLTGAAMYD